MEVYAIPVEGKFILYRPLLRLAFIGNRAMADLTLDLVRREAARAGDDGRRAVQEATNRSGASHDDQGQAADWVRSIGFLEPDPSPPPPPSPVYRPTTAVLLLTSRCNLRCTYCYARGGEGPAQDLSPSVARAVIDQVHDNAVEVGQPYFDLTFHGGGEPLQAWATLQEAVAYARSKSLPSRISMVSNGLCTVPQREWLLHNLDSLSISFDGRAATQDRQRRSASGGGSFKAAMRTIRALDKAQFSYGIRMTATAPWREQLPEDVRFICEETGCPAMQVEPAFNTRRGEHRGPTLEESEAFVDAFVESFEIAWKAGRQLTYSGARPWLLTSTFCTAPHAALIVNPAGKLVTCYEVADEGHPLAHLSTVGCVVGDQVAIDDQARSAFSTWLEQRRAGCSGAAPNSEGCFCIWHCSGDCYPRSFAAARTLPGTSSRCHANREITARVLLWYIMNSRTDEALGGGVWRGEGCDPQQAHLMRIT